jgi:hypothetical protein
MRGSIVNFFFLICITGRVYMIGSIVNFLGRKKYTMLPLIWTLPVLQMRKKEIDYASYHIDPTCNTNEKKEIDYASSHIKFLSSSFVVQVGSIW